MKTISIKNIKENTLKINEFALESAEKVISKTINTTEDFQIFTEKTLKKTLNFSEKQQDIFFTKAENAKSMIWKNLNKTLDFFSKN